MPLDGKTLQGLEKVATKFLLKNHQSYLSQALECVIETQDPVEALRLLKAMWGSSFGERPQEKAALNDVGKWLEERLHADPMIAGERIALEMGWLRRLAVITEANATKDQKNGVRAQQITFGKQISSIATRRERSKNTRPSRNT